jgi:hypothetical protein
MLYEFAGDILPKRLPLVLPVPDILALKERHFEAHLLLKDCEQGNGVSSSPSSHLLPSAAYQ